MTQIIIMAEYLTKLLNERHPDRRVIEDVLEKYLFNSDSDNERVTEFNFLGFYTTCSYDVK